VRRSILRVTASSQSLEVKQGHRLDEGNFNNQSGYREKWRVRISKTLNAKDDMAEFSERVVRVHHGIVVGNAASWWRRPSKGHELVDVALLGLIHPRNSLLEEGLDFVIRRLRVSIVIEVHAGKLGDPYLLVRPRRMPFLNVSLELCERGIVPMKSNNVTVTSGSARAEEILNPSKPVGVGRCDRTNECLALVLKGGQVRLPYVSRGSRVHTTLSGFVAFVEAHVYIRGTFAGNGVEGVNPGLITAPKHGEKRIGEAAHLGRAIRIPVVQAGDLGIVVEGGEGIGGATSPCHATFAAVPAS